MRDLDLRTGRAGKFEALARLRDKDATLVLPGQFLGAFGNNELLRLFDVVLNNACIDLRGNLFGRGEPVVSLNLPPQGLSDLRYQETLFRQLGANGISGHRIELEILETSELPQHGNHLHLLSALREAGIAIVQDDLGSGHSSLLRMGSLQFDGVKIEQRLVRGAMLRKPWRVLKFIYHLTNLAHSLGVPVTVEGLEDEGLIEAAAILGADYGQGYGIARPMSASAISEWREHFVWTVDRNQPETELGVLSAYLLWEQRLKAFPKNEPPSRVAFDQTSPFHSYLLRHPRKRTGLRNLSDAVEAHHLAAAKDVHSNDYKESQEEIIDMLSDWQRNSAST